MFFRLFNWLLKKVPYTLAVAIPNTFWAVSSATFGFFLILTKADFKTTGTEGVFIYAMLSFVAIAMLLVFLEFGILRFFGIKKWQRKEIKIINDNVLNGHICSEISDQTLLQVYNTFGKIYKWLLSRNIQYTSAVVIICALIEWFASGQLKNVPIILIGGAIAISISFICTIPLYELLLSPARRECKMFLAERKVNFKENPFLSLKIKSKFFIVLIALALGIILMLVPYLGIIPIIFFVITLLIISTLSGLVFESIYKAFVEIKESARELEKGKTISFFSGSLDKEIIDLSRSLNTAADEIYNVRNTLKIQVEARTKALDREKKSLERKVKDRTEELQERVSELEKFQKLIVGRELKMVELKREIRELKKKSEK